MKLLLAIAGRDSGQTTINFLLSLPWRKETGQEELDIDLLTVLTPFEFEDSEPAKSITDWSNLVDELRNRRRNQAEALLSQLEDTIKQSRKNCRISKQILETYSAANAIVETSQKGSCDLILMAARDKGRLNRILLGSVSSAVLNNAPGSVLLVRKPRPKDRAGLNVLIALDQSKFADKAFQSVLERDWPQSTHFKLVSVRKPPIDSCIDQNNPLAVMAILDKEDLALENAKLDLASKAANLRKSTRSDEIEILLLSGDPRDQILQSSENWPADLIVMGSQGRTGLPRLFLGSVSQYVAANATASVEVVKQ